MRDDMRALCLRGRFDFNDIEDVWVFVSVCVSQI